MTNTGQYNKELMLAHQHLKKQYQKFLDNNEILSEDESRAWAHAVQITGNIAYNCNITPKPNPISSKRE